MELDLGSIKIPVKAATKTFAILAKRGAGKSYTGAVLAEEFFNNGIPFVVFDPIDVWWGLRFAQDGKNKGLPVVVFGLEHADILLDKGMGRQIAQAIVEENLSCIISTFGMPKVAQRQLITEFSEEILTINNTPRHIFIEEAHEYVPQRVFGDMGKIFNSVSNLVVMGRNRGLGVTLINQRAATINKDVLTQVDTLLAFRNIAPQDRKALKEWVEYHSAEGDFEQFMKSLPSLPTGEGWIWSPEFLETFQRIKIRARRTFHPDRERLGNTFVMPDLEQRDVEDFVKRFRDLRPALPKERPKVHTVINNPTSADADGERLIASMRRQYETQLVAKESRIKQLEDKLASIAQIVQVVEKTEGQATSDNQITMWADKFGDTGAARILRYLGQKSGLKFTRSQIALAVGMSVRGGSFTNYLASLKRNNLIIEQNGEICINTDLFSG